MRKKRLVWQIFPVSLAITVLSLIAIGFIATRTARQFYYEQTARELESIAHVIRLQFRDHYTAQNPARIDSLAKTLGEEGTLRITVIRADGIVMGDTDEDPSIMENHADRPEIREALTGQTGISIRYSPTLQDRRVYLALPLQSDNQILTVIRVSRSVQAIDAALTTVYNWIVLGGVIIALLATLASYLASKRISKPLEEMRQGAEKFAAGDFNHRILSPKSLELSALAETLNHMAVQLRDRIATVVKQRNELETVLGSMVEGVVAFDTEERIISLNQAAAILLDIEQENVPGRTVQEIIVNPDFQTFVSRILHSDKALEEELVIQKGKRRYLQAHGTHLRDAGGVQIGALIVMNDVTRLRELENLRSEFVANVSHELRTPITSIQGFVETLQDGAIKNPDEAAHFLEIVARHVTRLNAIIEDLLSLAKIEREAEIDEIPLTQADVTSAVQQAINQCKPKAEARQVALRFDSREPVTAKVNLHLLEQALVNLLDNALNYSEADDEVLVSIEQDEHEIRLSVSDSGVGITAEHIARIFERFYRVNKDRSRKMGGTGLGLAIVKHIALSHHGSVSVESNPGEGSVFTIHLPRV